MAGPDSPIYQGGLVMTSIRSLDAPGGASPRGVTPAGQQQPDEPKRRSAAEQQAFFDGIERFEREAFHEEFEAMQAAEDAAVKLEKQQARKARAKKPKK